MYWPKKKLLSGFKLFTCYIILGATLRMLERPGAQAIMTDELIEPLRYNEESQGK
jgi:hypothetical protein